MATSYPQRISNQNLDNIKYDSSPNLNIYQDAPALHMVHTYNSRRSIISSESRPLGSSSNRLGEFIRLTDQYNCPRHKKLKEYKMSQQKLQLAEREHQNAIQTRRRMEIRRSRAKLSSQESATQKLGSVGESSDVQTKLTMFSSQSNFYRDTMKQQMRNLTKKNTPVMMDVSAPASPASRYNEAP